MLYAIVWSTAAALLAIWSLLAWAVQALGAWTITGAGALGDAAVRAGAPAMPDWLEPWLPPALVQALAELAGGLEPIVGALMQILPPLDGVLAAAVWVLWALGALALVLAGGVAHAAVSIWRRRRCIDAL